MKKEKYSNPPLYSERMIMYARIPTYICQIIVFFFYIPSMLTCIFSYDVYLFTLIYRIFSNNSSYFPNIS